MVKDKNQLAWGLILLLFGTFWLLSTLGVVGLPSFAGLFATSVLLVLAGLCYQAFLSDPRGRWGFLVPAGVLGSVALMVLAETVGFLPEAFLPLLFFAGPAAAFARIHALEPSRSWALVTAWLCAILGLTSFVGSLGILGGDLAGMVFLWGCGATLLWHFLRTGKDWAILPAGLLFTVGLIPLLENLPFLDAAAPAIVLFGLSASFAALYVLGRPGAVDWARFPAVALGILGGLVVLAEVARPLLLYGVPLALIAFGAYLILYARRPGSLGENG